MCFQAFCLEIIVLILSEYCKFFLFENSLQKMQNIILFSFPSNLSPYLSMPPSTCLFFWSKQVFQIISLSSDDCFPPKKEYSGPYTGFCFIHTLAHVLIHQRKIDNDLRKEITKVAILYPTMHFVSSRTQTFIQQENFLPVRFFICLP